MVYNVTQGKNMKRTVSSKLDEVTIERLREIAEKSYEGNISLTVRMVLREALLSKRH
jgi:hypothetical protein